MVLEVEINDVSSLTREKFRKKMCKSETSFLKVHREFIPVVVMWVHKVWARRVCIAIRGKVKE